VRYYVTLDVQRASKPVLVDLVELPGGALEVHVDGRALEVDVVEVSAGRGPLSARVSGQVVDLTTEGSPPDIGAFAREHRATVHVVSERRRSAEQARKSTLTGADTTVRSPMPGRVVQVLVARGAVVEAGQGLIVLEAMKMENEVRARVAGTVADVHVVPGAAVEAHAKLVTLT
jgi:biotin carboxyl carrier protein